ncbi:MAG: HAD-IA family hydrolase [Desulfococcaceae bacterium]
MKKCLIQAVLFDFDGTLTFPGAIDFPRIKKSIGCPGEIPVLEFIQKMENSEEKMLAMKILEDAEIQSARISKPNAGAEEIIRFLHSKGLKTGIVTRNSRCSVDLALKNFEDLKSSDFDVIITRKESAAPKPRPDGILLAAEKLGIKSENIIMIGDFAFDIIAGKAAGSVTVFLNNGSGETPQHECDYVISGLAELRNIVRLYLPLSAGKFPNDLLKEFLDDFNFNDSSVLINPGIGEDTAAICAEGEEVLILKSDPITFATDAIGQYAVLINANDIATAGAVPRWFLATLLFPCGITPKEVFGILRDLESVCRKWKITLCGGHTEITDAVNRTVISGMLAGTVKKADLIDKRSMRPGDRVLLTKGVAVEGTSIIAREFADRLRELGLDEDSIAMCRSFLSQISILDEARISAQCKGCSAMHDVTEGGLAGALEELSIAGGHRILVHMENIPIFPQTQALCSLLDIHPLGLIGSGSLIICCREEYCKELIAGIFHAGIQATVIGEILEPGQGIEALAGGEKVQWPHFAVDEITKLF